MEKFLISIITIATIYIIMFLLMSMNAASYLLYSLRLWYRWQDHYGIWRRILIVGSLQKSDGCLNRGLWLKHCEDQIFVSNMKYFLPKTKYLYLYSLPKICSISKSYLLEDLDHNAECALVAGSRSDSGPGTINIGRTHEGRENPGFWSRFWSITTS